MKNFKFLKKLNLSSILLVLLFVIGCSMENNDPVVPDNEGAFVNEDATASIAHLRQVNQDGPIYLSGVQNYYTYAVKTKEVLQDGDVDCLAIIEFLDGQNIQIIMTEYVGTPFERTFTLVGKMTPSGQVNFSFLEPGIIDIINLHSGCEVYGGPGINQNNLFYTGSFDGERLLASAPFYTKCEEWSLIPPPRAIEGPVQWKWTINMTVD